MADKKPTQRNDSGGNNQGGNWLSRGWFWIVLIILLVIGSRYLFSGSNDAANLVGLNRVADAVRNGEVESIVTIAVESVLKGAADAFVSMRVPGGTIGRYRTVMTGAPVMRVGDRAVFFLKRGPGNAFWPVGLSQGIYRVTMSGSGGMIAAPVVSGVTTNASGPVVRGDARRKALPVAEFESLVRLVVARGAQ